MNLYRAKATGVLFLQKYTPRANLMRGLPYDGSLYEFKTHGTNARTFAQVVAAVKELTGSATSIGIPGHDETETHLQRITDRAVRFRAIHSRPTRHNDQKLPLDPVAERARVDLLGRPSSPFERILLVDDITTTGQTMDLYSARILEEGVAREVVRFALAHKEGRHEREAVLVLGDPQAAPAPDLTTRPVEEVLEEFFLCEGVVEGERISEAELATRLGIKPTALRRKLETRRRRLLEGWGLDPADPLAAEIVKSLESVRRAQGDLEKVLHGLRSQNGEDALKDLKAAVDAQSKLARQRDGLVVRLKAETFQREKALKAGSGRRGLSIRFPTGAA